MQDYRQQKMPICQQCCCCCCCCGIKCVFRPSAGAGWPGCCAVLGPACVCNPNISWTRGTARHGPPAQWPTSEAEIKIDETRVDGAAAVRLLYQWSGWPGPSSMLAVLLQLNQNFVVLTLIPSESELWRTEHQASCVWRRGGWALSLQCDTCLKETRVRVTGTQGPSWVAAATVCMHTQVTPGPGLCPEHLPGAAPPTGAGWCWAALGSLGL